mmetsp:Transcript_10195/g.17175  ORF Transcript_10195/g.17175 Transcript_10195/m.17175 type:complete len:81 (-) Transcript_10195:338-580(-)
MEELLKAKEEIVNFRDMGKDAQSRNGDLVMRFKEIYMRSEEQFKEMLTLALKSDLHQGSENQQYYQLIDRQALEYAYVID